MQKGTANTHYKPVSELKTAKVLVRFNDAQMAQVKAAAAKDGQAVAPWIAARVLASINSSNAPQEETAPTATPAPEQAHPAPSQTDQETANKPNRPATKAKTTTTRRRKTSTTDDDAQPARKSSSTTTRRKTTTRRASTSRGKVVPKKDSAA